MAFLYIENNPHMSYEGDLSFPTADVESFGEETGIIFPTSLPACLLTMQTMKESLDHLLAAFIQLRDGKGSP